MLDTKGPVEPPRKTLAASRGDTPKSEERKLPKKLPESKEPEPEPEAVEPNATKNPFARAATEASTKASTVFGAFSDTHKGQKRKLEGAQETSGKIWKM